MAFTEGGTMVTYTHDSPYKWICSEDGVKCETCKQNQERSYYEPVEEFVWITSGVRVSTEMSTDNTEK